MSTVVELPPPQKVVDETIVKMLGDLLALAKDGQFLSVAVAVVYRDRNTGTFGSASECLSSQIGAISILLHEYNQMACDSTHQPRAVPDDDPA